MTRVANLKTSRPFIFTSRRRPRRLREPLPGSQRCSPPPPSAPSSKPGSRPRRPARARRRRRRRRRGRASSGRSSRGSSRARRRRRQAPSSRAGGDHRVGLREGVDETRAAGEKVVGAAFGRRQVAEERGRRREHHVRRDRGDDDQVDLLGLDACALERRPRRRQRQVRHGLSCAAIRRSLMPVRSMIHSSEVSTSSELGVVEHAVGHVGAEAGDRDRHAVRAADHLLDRESQRAAGGELAVHRGRRLARPIGPRTRSSSQVAPARRPARRSRLKRTPSMPANSASLPRFSSSESTATAPACAIASTIRTPGMIGRPGKWP